jgi:hypothetical protein
VAGRFWSDTESHFDFLSSKGLAMPPSAVCSAPSDAPDAAEGGEAGWVSDARRVVRDAPTDYFAVHPWRYWADFLISLVLAYASATLYLLSPLGSWPQLAAFPVAVFWLYRLGSLIH